MTPEAKARVTIDALLVAAGWHVCHVAQANIHAAVGVAIREFQLNNGFGFADYLLYVNDQLWPAQIGAITNLEKSLAAKKPKALIQMATGGNKTFTSIGFIYCLIKFGGARRVLLLVDRDNPDRRTKKELDAYASTCKATSSTPAPAWSTSCAHSHCASQCCPQRSTPRNPRISHRENHALNHRHRPTDLPGPPPIPRALLPAGLRVEPRGTVGAVVGRHP